jgi:transcription antitermination protein NusB
MKTSNDPRHQKRQHIVQLLFAQSFEGNQPVDGSLKDIIENREMIDKKITIVAPEFPIEKINKVDLAILRLAVYEISVAKNAPVKVIIDEAIELAKEYGGDSSPGFINGALGKLVKEIPSKT